MNDEISELIETPLSYKIKGGRILIDPNEYQRMLDIMKYASNGATDSQRNKVNLYVTREAGELRVQLSDTYLMEDSNYSLPLIMAVTSKYFEVSILNIIGPVRKWEYIEARRTFMYVAWLYKSKNRTSLTAIGEYVGHRDHSTVLHHKNLMIGWMSGATKDPKVVKAVSEIQRRVELMAEVLVLSNLRQTSEDIRRGDEFLHKGVVYIVGHGDGLAHCKAKDDPARHHIDIPYSELFTSINSLHIARENGIEIALTITHSQKKILYRTIGLHRSNKALQNRYVAGDGHPLYPELSYLVNIGFMRQTEPMERYDNSCLYYLTSNGMKAAELLKCIENGEINEGY